MKNGSSNLPSDSNVPKSPTYNQMYQHYSKIVKLVLTTEKHQKSAKIINYRNGIVEMRTVLTFFNLLSWSKQKCIKLRSIYLHYLYTKGIVMPQIKRKTKDKELVVAQMRRQTKQKEILVPLICFLLPSLFIVDLNYYI